MVAQSSQRLDVFECCECIGPLWLWVPSLWQVLFQRRKVPAGMRIEKIERGTTKYWKHVWLSHPISYYLCFCKNHKIECPCLVKTFVSFLILMLHHRQQLQMILNLFAVAKVSASSLYMSIPRPCPIICLKLQLAKECQSKNQNATCSTPMILSNCIMAVQYWQYSWFQKTRFRLPFIYYLC